MWHQTRKGRYFGWLFHTYFAAAVIFLVPWISLNGLNNPIVPNGEIDGGIINEKGHTGDFSQSSIASLAIMICVYHLIIFIFTRHYTAIIFTFYIISVISFIVVISLDNIESF